MRRVMSTILAFVMLLLVSYPARAITDSVSISNLPEYTRHDNFYISFSALSDTTPTARFYYKKDGDSYTQFGPTLNAYSGNVQVTGTQIKEQTKYFFKVEINGGTATDETSIIWDHSGPSGVQDYWKEKVGDGYYRLHWKNPGDPDFSRVFIYRSTETEFSADDSTKIGEAGGAPDDEMTFENPGLDPTKTYYYALRAVDKAGNGSAVVSDPETRATVVTETVVTEEEGGAEQVSVLPQEEEGQETGEGEVLGEEEQEDGEGAALLESPSPSPSPKEGIAQAYEEAKLNLFGTTKGRLALAGAFLIGFVSYFIWRKKSTRDF